MPDSGLIFLPTENMIIQETVQGKLDTASKPEPCDISLQDFDGTKYRIFVDPESPTLVYISIWLRCYAECYENGAAEMIGNIYAGLFTDEVEEGFDLTLCFDVADPPREAAVLVDLCANLKRNILAAPFERAFTAVKDSTTPPESCVLPFRENENCYIFPSSDRVTVFYNINFEDPNEQAIAKVFLQEFAEAKQRVKSGPPVSLSRDTPRDLESIGVEPGPGHVGYLSFIIFQSHVSSVERLENSATLLQGFRTYLQYHIKAAKSYLASRMRLRVSKLLKTLKEARPKGPAKQKKTIGGKTFKRG